MPEHADARTDFALRDGGFRVQARPARGPALWRHRDGRVMSEPAALALLAAERREALRRLERR